MPGPSFRDRAGKGTGLKYPTGKTTSSGGAKTTTKPSRAYTPPVQRGSSRGTPLAAVAPKTARRQAVKAQRVEKRQARRQQRKAQARRKLVKAVKKSGPTGLIKKLDRPFKPGETITPREAAIVTESVGLPGKTYAKGIIPGESGFQPGVRNPDDGTPSLYQITPSVQSAATKAKFDKIASKHKGGYSNPIAAAKQAKYLAQGGDGTSNYVAYDGSPIEHLPGGQKAARKKLYGKPKPVPKKIVKHSEKVLGRAKTKKIVARAKKAKPTGSAAPEKRPGPWAGAQRAVLSVVPKGVRAEGRGDKRTPAENASVGGSSTSDHLTTNEGAYAADLPANDAVARKIASRLGMASHTGTNEVTKDGYRYQLIWQDEGHYDHIHLGATWTGEKAPPGTSFGGPIGAPGGAVTSGGTTASAPATASARAKVTAAKTKGRRKSKAVAEFERRKRLALELLGDDNPSAVPPSSSYKPSVRTYADTVSDR